MSEGGNIIRKEDARDKAWRAELSHTSEIIQRAIRKALEPEAFRVGKVNLLPNSGGMHSIEILDNALGFDISVIIKPANGVWITDEKQEVTHE